MKNTQASLFFLLFFLAGARVEAIDTTFTGGYGNWEDSGNWSDGVPNNGVDIYNAFIPVGTVDVSSAITIDNFELGSSNAFSGLSVTDANFTVLQTTNVPSSSFNAPTIRVDGVAATADLGILTAYSANTLNNLRLDLVGGIVQWQGANIYTIGQNADILLEGTTAVIRNSLDASDALAVLDTNRGSFGITNRSFTTAGNLSSSGQLSVSGWAANSNIQINGALAQNTGGTLTGGSLSATAMNGYLATIGWEGAQIQTIASGASVSLQGAGSGILNTTNSSDALAGLNHNEGQLYLSDRSFLTAGDFSNTGYLSVNAYDDAAVMTVNGALAQNTGGVLTAGNIQAYGINGNLAVIEWAGAAITTIGNTAAVTLVGANSFIRNSTDASDALAGLSVNEGYFQLSDKSFTTVGNFSNAGSLSVSGYGENSVLAVNGTLAENTAGVLTAGYLSVSSDNGSAAAIQWEGANIQTIGNVAGVYLYGVNSSIRNSTDDTDALAGLQANEGSLQIAERAFTTAGDFSNAGTLNFQSYTADRAFSIMGALAQNIGGQLTEGSFSVYSANGYAVAIEWAGASIQTIGVNASVYLDGAGSNLRNSADASDALAELQNNQGSFGIANRDVVTAGDFSNTGNLFTYAWNADTSLTISGTLAQNSGGFLTAGTLQATSSADPSHKGYASIIAWQDAEIHTIGAGAAIVLQGQKSAIQNSVNSSDALAGLEANEGYFQILDHTFTTAGNFSNTGYLDVGIDGLLVVGAGGNFTNEGTVSLSGLGSIATQMDGDMILTDTSVITFYLFVNAPGSLEFGKLNSADLLSLDGDIELNLNVFNGADSAGTFIDPLASYEIALAANVLGSFNNVASGERIYTSGGDSFLLTINAGSVVLSDFSAVPEPSTGLLLILGVGIWSAVGRRRTESAWR